MLVSALEFLDSLNKIMFSKINILCKVWPSFFRWYVCWLQQLPPSEGLSELWWREALFWFSLIKALQARKTMWKIKIEKLEPVSAEVRDGEMSARMEWKWGTASMDANECWCPHMAKVLPFCCTVSSCANLLQIEQLSPLRRLHLQGDYPLCTISRGRGREGELIFLHAGKWKKDSGLLVLALVGRFMSCWVSSQPWNSLSQLKQVDMPITGHYRTAHICGLTHVASHISRKWHIMPYPFSRDRTLPWTNIQEHFWIFF